MDRATAEHGLDHGVSARRVVDEEGRLVGLVTTEVVTTEADEDIRVAARSMIDRGVQCLSVVEDGRVVESVSRHDLRRLFGRSDSNVAAEIEAKLASPRYAPENHEVTFSVAEGVVILEGKVGFQGEVGVVEGLVWGVPGVVHVVNKVEFKFTEGR